MTIVAPLPARGPRLVVTDADGRAREVPLAKPETRIGRSTKCDIVLSNPDVSRLQAAIVERPGGHALLPISARETTFLNGETVTGERFLHDGDEILLGSQRLVYRQAAGEKVLSPGSRRRVLAATAGAAAALGIVALVVFFGSIGRHEGDVPTGKGADADEVGSAPVAAQGPTAPVPAGTPEPAAATAPAEQQAAVTPAEAPPSATASAAEDREQKIRKLLYEGDVAFLEHRYLSPPEGSAVLAYLEVLKLDPTNERARGQLGLIVDDYLAWAERAMKQGNSTQALLFADKAAYIQRQAPDVLSDPAIERRLAALRR